MFSKQLAVFCLVLCVAIANAAKGGNKGGGGGGGGGKGRTQTSLDCSATSHASHDCSLACAAESGCGTYDNPGIVPYCYGTEPPQCDVPYTPMPNEACESNQAFVDCMNRDECSEPYSVVQQCINEQCTCVDACLDDPSTPDPRDFLQDLYWMYGCVPTVQSILRCECDAGGDTCGVNTDSGCVNPLA